MVVSTVENAGKSLMGDSRRKQRPLLIRLCQTWQMKNENNEGGALITKDQGLKKRKRHQNTLLHSRTQGGGRDLSVTQEGDLTRNRIDGIVISDCQPPGL